LEFEFEVNLERNFEKVIIQKNLLLFQIKNTNKTDTKGQSLSGFFCLNFKKNQNFSSSKKNHNVLRKEANANKKKSRKSL